jgi:hypothetical protein
MPDPQHVHCLQRLGLRGLHVEQPVHRWPGLRFGFVWRLHVERTMRRGAGLRGRSLRRLRDGRSVRPHRAVFGHALGHRVHVLRQRRLRVGRRLRLRHLRAGLRLERRLRAGPSLRGRGLRRLHVERTMRVERDGGMPRGDVFLFHAGRLRVGSGLRFGQLRRVPVEHGLRRAGLHLRGLRSVLDVRRLQPDNPQWGPWSCVRERRMRRMYLQQPVRGRGGLRRRNVRHVRAGRPVRIARELRGRWHVPIDDRSVHRRVLHVLHRHAMRAGATLRCKRLRIDVNVGCGRSIDAPPKSGAGCHHSPTIRPNRSPSMLSRTTRASRSSSCSFVGIALWDTGSVMPFLRRKWRSTPARSESFSNSP